LVTQLFSLKSILLLFKLVHELHLLLLHLIFPVEHTILTLHKRVHSGFFVCLHIINLLLLITLSLAFECVKLFLGLIHLFLKVSLYRSVFFSSSLHQILEHEHFLLSLTILKNLLLLSLSIKLNSFELFSDCLLFVRVVNIKVHFAFSHLSIKSLHLPSEVIFINKTLLSLASE